MTTFDRSVLPHGKWTTWNFAEDIREAHSAKSIFEFRKWFWCQEGRLEPRIYDYVRALDENAVAFAIAIAHSPQCLRIRDVTGMPLIHNIILLFPNTPQLVRLLVRYDPASLDILDTRKNGPYHIAARKGLASMLTQMINPLFGNEMNHPFFDTTIASIPGVSIGEVNTKGEAPVHLITHLPSLSVFKECLHILVDQGGVNINFRQSSDGYTPAHLVLTSSHPADYLELLIKYGARMQCRNQDMLTISQLAYRLDNVHCMLICQSIGKAHPCELRELYAYGNYNNGGRDECTHPFLEPISSIKGRCGLTNHGLHRINPIPVDKMESNKTKSTTL